MLPREEASFEVLSDVLITAAMPGAAGGVAWFLRGIRCGRIRNDKYLRKATLEALGGMIVASFVALPLAPVFSGSAPVIVLSFATGTCWSVIIQRLRDWITKFIDKGLP